MERDVQHPRHARDGRSVPQPAGGFDPERFGTAGDDARGAAGRFHYIPFGGGARSCLGQELAQTVLQLLAVELVRTALGAGHACLPRHADRAHHVRGGRAALFFHPLASPAARDGQRLLTCCAVEPGLASGCDDLAAVCRSPVPGPALSFIKGS